MGAAASTKQGAIRKCVPSDFGPSGPKAYPVKPKVGQECPPGKSVLAQTDPRSKLELVENCYPE